MDLVIQGPDIETRDLKEIAKLACAQSIEQRSREVQARRGRGHRAWPRRIDRLIALGIDRGVGVRNVGRQWHVAILFQDWQYVAIEAQQEEVFAALRIDERGR